MSSLVVAIIPARKNSQRLPGKNTKILAGRPLISWSINAAINCTAIHKVVVSSDDPEVLMIANELGVIGIHRPVEFASDTATSFDVVSHVFSCLEFTPPVFVLLQPTSPLRGPQHIEAALQLFFSRSADSVISVCETEHSPLWANTLPLDGDMKNFLRPEVQGVRSQELPTFYRLNGAIYVANSHRYLDKKNFFLDKALAYIMPNEASVDIDTQVDFDLADILMRRALL